MYTHEPTRWKAFLNTLNTEAYRHMHEVYLAEWKRQQADLAAAEIEKKNRKKRK